MAWGFWEKYIENPVKELGRDVEDETRALGRKIDDEIIEPVGNAVEAIVENPRALAGLALAIAFPGAGAALGAQLGLFGTLGQIVGQTLINTVVNGGDVKNAVIGAVLPEIGKQISGAIGGTLSQTQVDELGNILEKTKLETTVNAIVTRGATQAATAAILGKDPLTAFVMGGVSAGIGAITEEIPGFRNLPAPAQNALTAALGTKLVGGDTQKAITDSLVNDAVKWAKDSYAKLEKATSKSSWTPERIAFEEAKDLYRLESGGGELPDDVAFASFVESSPQDFVNTVDALKTTHAEARDIYDQAFGEGMSSYAHYEDILGLPEDLAREKVQNYSDYVSGELETLTEGVESADAKQVILEYILGAPENSSAAELMADIARGIEGKHSAQELDDLLRGYGNWSNLLENAAVGGNYQNADDALDYTDKLLDAIYKNDSIADERAKYSPEELNEGLWFGDQYMRRDIAIDKYGSVDAAAEALGSTAPKTQAQKTSDYRDEVAGKFERAIGREPTKTELDFYSGVGSVDQVLATEGFLQANGRQRYPTQEELSSILAGAAPADVWKSSQPVAEAPVEVPGMKELQDILAGAGSGTQYAGAGSGTATDAGGGGGPDTSWAVTAADERIVGARTRDDGSKAVAIERINPNNPSETLTYEAVRDPETGEVYYEWGGIEFDEDGNPTLGGSSVSASKPSWTWGLPEGVGSPEVDEPDVPPDFNFGDLDLYEPPQEPTIDDLIKELTPTEPKPTPVEPTPTEPLPETTVDDLIKDLTPVEPAPVEPAPSEPPPETTPSEPTPVEQTPTEPVQPAPEQPTPIEPTPTDPEQTPAEPTPEAPTEPTPVEPEQPVGPTPVEPTTPPTDQAPPTAGITPGEVKQIVDDALAANPNLTADDVRAIVGDAVATIPNLTADQVRQIVGSELANLPVGATPGDIQTAVTDVEASISETRKILEDAIKAAQDIGLQGDAALQAGIDSVAAELGTTKADLLTQLGATEETLRTEFGTGLAGVSAEVKAAYDSLSAEQKALANQLTQQGTDLASAIQAAQQQTQGQIGGLSADMQAKYDALTAGQKAEADARVAQGQGLQDAITGVAGKVTGLENQLGAQGRDFANQLMQQGMDYNTALQTAISAQSALFGTQIGDVQSQIAAAEAARQADARAQLAREQAAEQARVAQAAQAAAAAKAAQRQAAIRTNLGQGQQQLQQIAKQVPQAFQQAQTTTTPIYGEMGPYLDLGSPLDFDFFKPSPEKQAATKQQQPTKIATGGYIDDLLAGDMTVDELLNLLR